MSTTGEDLVALVKSVADAHAEIVSELESRAQAAEAERDALKKKVEELRILLNYKNRPAIVVYDRPRW